jgi:Flp pilus assembly protein TadG
LSSTTSRSGERGQVLVLFAGGLLALLLIAALAFDVGMMLVERRDEQDAADAAALAGARYVLTDEIQARATAREIAQINGYDDADANEIVNVYIPAIHGRYAGLPGFIEVQIEATRASIFGGVIGKANWPIGAFAVATNSQNLTFPFSMLALNPTACKAIAVSGGGVVEANANIQSNSNGSGCAGDPVGFSRTGGATINVNAPDATCRVVGEFLDQGSGPPIDCTITENSFALPDPLRNLGAPAKPALAAPMDPLGHTKLPPDYCPGATPKAPSETQPKPCDVGGNGSSYANLAWILHPGLYPHGLSVSNGAKAYLLPGVYWIGGGGVDVGGGGSIVTVATAADANVNPSLATWGGGVLVYNSKLPTIPGGPFSLNSNGAVMKLKPLNLPTTDANHIFNTMVIYQDRTVTSPITLNGSASTTIVEGIIYAPAAQIKLNGNGGTLVVDQVIADTFDINGNGGTIKVLRGTGIDAVIVAAGLVD